MYKSSATKQLKASKTSENKWNIQLQKGPQSSRCSIPPLPYYLLNYQSICRTDMSLVLLKCWERAVFSNIGSSKNEGATASKTHCMCVNQASSPMGCVCGWNKPSGKALCFMTSQKLKWAGWVSEWTGGELGKGNVDPISAPLPSPPFFFTVFHQVWSWNRYKDAHRTAGSLPWASLLITLSPLTSVCFSMHGCISTNDGGYDWVCNPMFSWEWA